MARPAETPEEYEAQMIFAANELAKKQMLEGTASAQVITHFLKLGSSREKLEQERLKHETELVKARIESAASNQRIEELYASAMAAMISYSGSRSEEVIEEYLD